jgi:hypothetical protein
VAPFSLRRKTVLWERHLDELTLTPHSDTPPFPSVPRLTIANTLLSPFFVRELVQCYVSYSVDTAVIEAPSS